MDSFIIENESINFKLDKYKAGIERVSTKKRIKPFEKNGLPCRKFSTPVTNKNIAKIYIIYNKNHALVYIGKTTQSITNRLRQGLNPISGSGYHGYRWQEKENIYIHCITIPSFTDKEIEATEAELVYLHKKLTGKWPLYQSEIHFSNNNKAAAAAEKIYKIVAKNTSIMSNINE